MSANRSLKDLTSEWKARSETAQCKWHCLEGGCTETDGEKFEIIDAKLTPADNFLLRTAVLQLQ